MTELKAILAAREPLYAQAERTVETSGRAADRVAAALRARTTNGSGMPNSRSRRMARSG